MILLKCSAAIFLRRRITQSKSAIHFFSRTVKTTLIQRIQPLKKPLFSTDIQDFVTYPKDCSLNILAELEKHGFRIEPEICSKVISTCAKIGSLSLGVQMHTHVIKLGFCLNIYINSALVDMYGKCGVIFLAHRLFDEMPERNAVTWNSLISGYLDTLFPEMAMRLFMEMLRVGISLTPYSISAALVGCAYLQDAELGSQVHGLSLKFGFEFNVVVGTGLIDMYSKCFQVEASRRVFDRMAYKNVLSCTSMITGYAQSELSAEAMIILREMLRLGIKANYVTYTSLLSSFCCADDLDYCREIHSRIVQEGFESNNFVVVTLLTAYSDCGCSSEDFHKICSIVIMEDQISWNAVVAAYSNVGNGVEALICFSNMRQEGITLDVFTYTSVLKAIGIITALEEGKQVHGLVLKTGYYASNVCVQNGLVSMYAKCGDLTDAKKVFLSMNHRDLISWNSLLSGYANHGYGMEAVKLFEEMRKSSVKPNLTTFLIVLSACSHFGLLDKGQEFFESMKNDDSLSLPPPSLEHYACMVDLYGRAGCLQEAETFIDKMPIKPGLSVFKALLSASMVYGNKEIAERSARRLVQLCPNDPATYVTLANVFATEGKWTDAAEIRKLMVDRGVKKKPGSSWI